MAPSPQLGMAVSDSLAVVSLSPVVVLVGSLARPVLVDASVVVDAPALVGPVVASPVDVLASVAELVGAVVAEDGPLVARVVPPLSLSPPPPQAANMSTAHEQIK